MIENVAASAVDWLRERTAAEPGGSAPVVSGIVPAGFPSYLRVFHSWYAEEDPARRSTWRERAALCGARYAGDLTVGSLDPALSPPLGETEWTIDEGEPDEVTRAALATVLARVTGTRPVYFAYDLAAAVAGADEPIVVRASLDELPEVRRWIGLVGPEHWWPEDRAWVVRSDYDLCSTYVACSADLAGALLAADDVEAVPVTSDTRLS